MSAFTAHRKLQLEERLRAGSEWQENGLIFASQVGTPLSRHNLTRSWKRLLKRAGLPDTKFHNLRHTCATLLLSRGYNAKFVQELQGHATVAITLDTYSHVLPDLQREATDRLDVMLY